MSNTGFDVDSMVFSTLRLAMRHPQDHPRDILTVTRLLFLLKGRRDVPPQDIDTLLRVVYELSLNEIREAGEWQMESYTSVLCCTRGYHAQTVFDMIEKVRDSFLVF